MRADDAQRPAAARGCDPADGGAAGRRPPGSCGGGPSGGISNDTSTKYLANPRSPSSRTAHARFDTAP